MALAQEERELGVVIVPLPVLRHVRHDGLEVVGHAHQIHVSHREQVRGTRLGRVRQHVQHTTVPADLLVGGHDQRLLGQTFGKRRQIRVPGDAAIQLGDGRVLLEGEGAAGELLELGQLVLLRVLPGRDTHRVGDGGRRAVAGQNIARQQHQASTHAEETVVHNVAP